MFTNLIEPAATAHGTRIEVRGSEVPGEVIVRVAGEAGVGQAGQLEAALLARSARRPPLVTLDLSGVNFISCLALGLLAAFRRGVARAGGRVRLAPALLGRVREGLERAGLLALFG